MRDLPRRTITAIAYGAVVLAGIFAPPIFFAVLLAVGGIIALAELYALRRAGGAVLVQGLVLVFGLVSLWLLRSVVVLPAGFLTVPRRVIEGLGYADPSAWPYTVQFPYALVMVILATWAADVFAYVGGSLFGQRKIAPTISPGKTWEGTVIGFVAAALVFVGLDRAFGSWYPVAIAIGILIGPVAFAGDLLESWIKRRAGVKDSGNLFPGHGGMLDRIDSLVATASFALLPLLVPCCAPSLG